MRTFLYTAIIVLLGAIAPISSMAKEGDAVSVVLNECRFDGLEYADRADNKQYKITVVERKAVGDGPPALFVGFAFGEESGLFRGQRMEPDENFLHEITTVIEKNLKRFEEGAKDLFTSVERAAEFLQIERPYYEAIQEHAHTVDVFRYPSRYGIGHIFYFLDEHEERVGVYAVHSYFKMANFCTPAT